MGTKSRRLKTIQWYYSKNIDIALTQETHSCLETENTWRNEWDGHIYFSHGTSSARGACIFIRSHIQHEIHKEISDANGRYIILDLTIDGTRLTLASTECSEISAIAENGYKMVILTDMNFIFHNNNLDNMRNCSDKWPICNQNSLEKKEYRKY